MKYAFFSLLCFFGLFASAQSFYDLGQIQDIKIYFAFDNWDYRLDTAKAGMESYIEADSVVINAKTIKNCGIKYKGNSSYDVDRPKNPIHIKLDYLNNGSYQGLEEIKLGNGWSDNSMIREPLCYAILRQYMDAPRGNFAKVYINGNFYGLMNNAESITEDFILQHFYTSKYPFVKCNPLSIGSGLGNGPNLGFLGTNVGDYSSKYELKSDTGWSALIRLCDTLNNHFDAFGQIADVDRILWMLAFNNALVNLDSYTGTFRQNYYLYRDHNGKWIPIVWDLNMCMGGFSVAGGTTGALTPTNMPTMNYTLHKSETGWPLINKLLNTPLYSKMYFAHLRTINKENFANGQYKILADSLHTLVDAAVQNEPNFLSTYDNFKVSLTTTTPGSNAAGPSPGIYTLMDARAAYLTNVLSAAAPLISNVALSNGSAFGEMANIQATVNNSTAVYLGYRYDKASPFQRVPMYDDGLHGDGAAGDLVFATTCPLSSLNIQYYIYAENANTGAFSPERAEHEFYQFKPTISPASPGTLLLNEITANNSDGIENEKGKIKDWIELYNNSNQALGLSHLYLSKDAGDLAKWAFPEDAFIGPQAHLLVWADDLDEPLVELHSNFTLSRTGEQLLLSDGTTVYDQLEFGDQLENYSLSRCAGFPESFIQTVQRTPRAANDCSSATNEANNIIPLRVAPNPTDSWLRIDSDQHIESISLYAVDGRRLFSSQELSLDLSGLPAGLYWIEAKFVDGKRAGARVVRGN